MTAKPDDTGTCFEASHPPSGLLVDDPLIVHLHTIIRWAVKALAVLMTLVIVYGVLDVAGILFGHIIREPFLLLQVDKLMEVFGAFLAVLIAIEVFVNITVYLREDVIHVKIVMATALMAIARKVIILDTKETAPATILGIAAVVLAMSLGYWLVVLREKNGKPADRS